MNFNKHFIHDEDKDILLIATEDWTASACLHQYHDDKTIVYLSNLYVDSKLRKQGIGTKLQEFREEMGRELGAKMACLWVKKDSYMYEWYKRRDYIYLQDHENEGYVWMVKKL